MQISNINNKKQNPISSDLLLINANVVTLDPGRPRAQLVAVRNGRVLLVGDDRNLERLRGSKPEVIDCRGKTVLPGFIDVHCHFISLAESLMSCSFTPKDVHSISDIQDKIRKFAEKLPPGTWIRARAYDEFYLDEKRHPMCWDLDEATSKHPVKLTHRSGHAHVLNSLAMEIAGISAKTPEPSGAIIERDLNTGDPNGVLFEMGPYLSKIIPALKGDDQMRAVRRASQQLLSCGITSIQDASSHNDLNRRRLFYEWKENGDLKCRVDVMLGYEAFESCSPTDSSHEAAGEHIPIPSIKIIVNETTGQLDPPQSELNERVLEIHQSGLQAAIHAIEETQIEAACSAISYALQKSPRSDPRHRIEHCSVCPPQLCRRLASLGVVVVTQPSFIYYNGDRYLRTVPSQQLRNLYPIGSLMKNGVMVAASSDCPVVPPNPLIGIYSAISRTTEAGRAVLPKEKIDPLEALRMHTQYAARAIFQEKTRGSIAVGKLADLVVLSDDPTGLRAKEVRDIQVEMTIINGEVVWTK